MHHVIVSSRRQSFVVNNSTKVINDQNQENQIHSIYHYHGFMVNIFLFLSISLSTVSTILQCPGAEVPQPRRQQQLGLGVSPPPPPPPGYLGDHVLDTEDILYKVLQIILIL